MENLNQGNDIVSVGMTMSSLEIAGLTGKRHDHVIRDADKMLSELGIDAPSFGAVYRAGNGEDRRCLNLPKRETLILVSGYSVEMRARIIDRWMELEVAVAGQAPTSFPAGFAEKLDRMFGIERMLAHKVTEIEKAIPGIVSQSVEKAIMSDPRRAVLDYVSVRQLLDDAKALQKGRQSLNRKVGYALRDLAAAEAGAMAAKCPHTGVWLFRRSLAEPFMRGPGAALVKAHNDRVSGQGVLKLVRKEKPDFKTPE
jgi:hypothetical protein